MTIPLLNFILFDYYYIADIYANSYFENILDLEKNILKILGISNHFAYCVHFIIRSLIIIICAVSSIINLLRYNSIISNSFITH